MRVGHFVLFEYPDMAAIAITVKLQPYGTENRVVEELMRPWVVCLGSLVFSTASQCQSLIRIDSMITWSGNVHTLKRIWDHWTSAMGFDARPHLGGWNPYFWLENPIWSWRQQACGMLPANLLNLTHFFCSLVLNIDVMQILKCHWILAKKMLIDETHLSWNERER